MRSCVVTAFLFAAGSAGCGGPPAFGPIPSVILISIDTLRPDHLGCYGYGGDTSPNLDRLAAGGVLFEQAISAAPWTLPSHAGLLASVHPAELPLGDSREPGSVPESARLLAEVLQEAGFRTRAQVAGGFLSREFGFTQGFQEYLVHQHLQYAVREAKGWLLQLEPHERFFLFLHTYQVHDYDPPDRVREKHVQSYQGALKDLTGPDLVELMTQMGNDPEIMGGLAEQDRRYLIDLYDATIAGVDRRLGVLFEFLEEHGMAERTLIVITSDHGEELFDHGGGGHGFTLFDENLRVPLLFVHDLLPRLRVAGQVRGLDVAPTIADLLRVEPAEAWQGQSLVPCFGGAAPDLAAFTSETHVSPSAAVRTESLKYISGTLPALYDLAVDPGERENLAGRGDPREAELRNRLDASIEEYATRRTALSFDGVDIDPDLNLELRRLGYLDGPED